MAKKKPSKDINVTAFEVLQHATGQAGLSHKGKSAKESEKNPAAVALGRLGGMKGGKARAQKLSKEKRSQIAKKAALVRWSVKP